MMLIRIPRWSTRIHRSNQDSLCWRFASTKQWSPNIHEPYGLGFVCRPRVRSAMLRKWLWYLTIRLLHIIPLMLFQYAHPPKAITFFGKIAHSSFWCMFLDFLYCLSHHFICLTDRFFNYFWAFIEIVSNWICDFSLSRFFVRFLGRHHQLCLSWWPGPLSMKYTWLIWPNVRWRAKAAPKTRLPPTHHLA